MNMLFIMAFLVGIILRLCYSFIGPSGVMLIVNFNNGF